MNCLDCGSTMERGGTPIPACFDCAVTAVECEEREARKLQLAQHITGYPAAGHIFVATRSQTEQEEWREADQRQRYRDAGGVL